MKMMDANEIISFIQNSTKSTPVKVYVKGELEGINFGESAKALSTETLVSFSVNGAKSKQQLKKIKAKSKTMWLKMTAAILRFQRLILKISKRVSSRARSSATKLKSVITQSS